jgi:hypothetical protein
MLQEMYEPLWDELYERMAEAGKRIRGVWIADVAHQGESGVLNEKALGSDRSCTPSLRLPSKGATKGC